MKKRVGNRVLMLLENACYPKDTRVRLEAHALIEAGCEVTLICPAEKGQPMREVRDGLRLLRFPQPGAGGGLLGYVWEYAYSMVAVFVLSIVVFFKRGFDVIHANNPPDLFVLIAVFYKLLGKRLIFDHHDLAPEMYYARFDGKGNRFVYRVLLFFEWLSCRVADHVIATNESYKALEQQRDGVPADRITVVRNGPELERFEGATPSAELRKKAGTIIGYLGVMGFQDGVDYLLRAIKHLIEDLGRTDVYCLLLGTGDAWDDLKALTSELDLDDYVWFSGYVTGEKLRSCLATADILAAPEPKNAYNDRSTMIKMMEYMAVEKPIVAFDLTEHRVSAEDAALYAQPNDTLDFARQIAVLMDDPALGRRMGSLGRRRVESCLAWSYQRRCLVEAYGKLDVPVRGLQPETPEKQKPAAIPAATE